MALPREYKSIGAMDHTIGSRAATPTILPDRSFDYDFDRALVFMAKTIDACGHNPKPLVLHSTRVGMCLYNYGYGRDVVLTGVLHDLIEDEGTRRYMLTCIGNLLTLSANLLSDESVWGELHRQWVALHDLSGRGKHDATSG